MTPVQPLKAALDDTLRAWEGETGQRPPAAIWCAEPHPFAPEVLCRRLDGHGGVHQSDGLDAWNDDTQVDEPPRSA